MQGYLRYTAGRRAIGCRKAVKGTHVHHRRFYDVLSIPKPRYACSDIINCDVFSRMQLSNRIDLCHNIPLDAL